MTAKTKAPVATCEWCTTPLAAGDQICVACNASAPKSLAEDIPGLTAITGELQVAQRRYEQHIANLKPNRLVKFLVGA